MARLPRLLPLLVVLLTAAAPRGLLAAEPQGLAAIGSGINDQSQRFLGAWALVDNRNNLFNVRVSPDGPAISTSGVDGPAMAGSNRLRPDQNSEQGRWQPWGNGIRIDYSDGWTDAILTGPAGPEQWSWEPGRSRLEPPSNRGKAVQLTGAIAEVVGVYRIQPAQPTLPATTVSLLSNGLAFNAMDPRAGGVWRLQGSSVMITWLSGWQTQFEPSGADPLRVRIWQPGRRPPAPPTAIRPGSRL